MSCTFWLRRKKKNAMMLEQKRKEAEKQAAVEQVEAAPKPARKRVAKAVEANNDNAGTV